MNQNEQSFTDRMAEAKEIAVRDRNRGNGGSAFGKVRKPLPDDTQENRLLSELADLRKELKDRNNTIAVMKIHGAIEPDYGAEFDAIFDSVKTPKAVETMPTDSQEMSTKQFVKALRDLGLSPASKRTAEALGLSVRQVQRIVAGQPVPNTLAKLIRMYLVHGMED